MPVRWRCWPLFRDARKVASQLCRPAIRTASRLAEQIAIEDSGGPTSDHILELTRDDRADEGCECLGYQAPEPACAWSNKGLLASTSSVGATAREREEVRTVNDHELKMKLEEFSRRTMILRSLSRPTSLCPFFTVTSASSAIRLDRGKSSTSKGTTVYGPSVA